MKKMKQVFKNLFFVVALTALTVSCSSDDNPSGPEVKYRLTTTADVPDMTNFITMRGKNGSLVGVPIDNLSGEWSKTFHVNPPFSAYLNAEFNNATGSAQDYTLYIYVDGETVETISGTVNNGITTSQSLTFDVE